VRRHWRTALAVVLLVVGGGLLGVTVVDSDDPSAPPGSAGSAPPDPGGRADADSGAEDEPELLEVQQAREVAAPTRVEVPSLGISSDLDRLGTDGTGRLETPPQWQVAGWFASGPRPGDDGPAVIAGHVDSPTGPAVFARLSELEEGDLVRVTDAEGVVREFAVTSTTTTPQDGFPTEAVYGPTPDSQLRLITCDGPYDAANGGYQDNLLVFATEVAP